MGHHGGPGGHGPHNRGGHRPPPPPPRRGGHRTPPPPYYGRGPRRGGCMSVIAAIGIIGAAVAVCLIG